MLILVFNAFLFIASFFLLAVAARILVNNLTSLAKFFEWREFVLVYFVLVMGATIPNLTIGIFATLEGVPDLFLGDVLGNSIITITLITSLAVFFGGTLQAPSRVVQQSALFLVAASVMPLLLMMDGVLSRGDGVVLLIIFFFYSTWLYSKRRLFHSETEDTPKPNIRSLKDVFYNIFLLIIGVVLLLLAGSWIVKSSSFFAEYFSLPLLSFGIILVALGTSLPELFFIVTSARKKNNWLVLGGVIGDVIVLPTLGLGLIAVISPIEIAEVGIFIPLFFFLIIGSLFFLFFIRSDKRITWLEAAILFVLYLSFILIEIFNLFTF